MSKIKNWDFRTKASIIITAAFLLLFFTIRLLFLLTYRDEFGALSALQVTSAFLQGFRFDFSMVATFVLPLVLIFNIPLRAKLFSKIILYITAIMFLIFTGALAGDYIYFGLVQKHMAEELLVIGNDIGFLLSYAFTQFYIPLILLAAGFGLVIWLITKAVNKYFFLKPTTLFKELPRFFIIALLIVFGIRGKVFDMSKPLGIADVHNYSAGAEHSNLMINGLFTSYHTLRKGYIPFNNPMPVDRAIEQTQKLVAGKKNFFPSKDYPLMQQIKPEYKFNNYNVFVVLLEGWNPNYIDALTPQGADKFGVTPYFDQIVKDSVIMTNAYSAGLRSIMGFGAAYAGVPFLPSMPMFGYGLELSETTSIGRALKEQGYYGIFAQTSNRDSYRMTALGHGVLGMQDSYGREDIPLLLDYKQNAPFGYDYDMLMFVADKVKNKDNFIALTFTGITHDPFTVTLEEFEKYPRDSFENEYLNVLYYADFSIGKLIEKAKEDGWYDNTVFVFLSDHTQAKRGRKTIKGNYRIPFVIHAPKILKPQKIEHTISQLDLIPTLYDILNIPSPYTALGKSVFDGPQNRAAFVAAGEIPLIITDDGALMHNGNKILLIEDDNENFDTEKAEEELLSMERASVHLLRANKWFDY